MVREICEIHIIEDDDGKTVQQTAGTFILDDGKLGFSAEPPYADSMFHGLMLVPAYVVDVGDVTPKINLRSGSIICPGRFMALICGPRWWHRR